MTAKKKTVVCKVVEDCDKDKCEVKTDCCVQPCPCDQTDIYILEVGYRFAVRRFERRVNEALAKGYKLYGAQVATKFFGKMVCSAHLIKEENATL
jgi:hypothetical protein